MIWMAGNEFVICSRSPLGRCGSLSVGAGQDVDWSTNTGKEKSEDMNQGEQLRKCKIRHGKVHLLGSCMQN